VIVIPGVRGGACFAGAAAALVLLAGCAGVPQTQALLHASPGEIGRAAELSAVPFFPQDRFQCGPAALATVLGWGGIEVTPEELEPRVYVPARQGSLQPELLAAARQYRRVPYVLAPQLTDVLREVRAGHPVMILQNLAYDWYPRWHYAVVVGYDLDRRELILRSGTIERHVMSLRTFERTWQRGGRWAVVMLDAAGMPVSAGEEDYLRAVLPFEQSADWETAATAYRSATARWPASAGAWFGLGNSAYHLRDYAGAEAAFQRVLEHRPDHAAALNNLAYVLLMQGEPVEARQLAERALALDPGNSDYVSTLEEIRRALSADAPIGSSD
jgi:tetratricopeptide (TPR) repeat protein